MKENISKVLTLLKEKGVQYADIRIVDRTTENITTENSAVRRITDERSKGAGIRVIYDGSMGFASTNDLDRLEATALMALETAMASRTLQKGKIVLAKKDAVHRTKVR